MTVSTYAKDGPYAGDASTGQAFTITFEFFDTSEVVAITRVTATGVEAVLDETTDYTISGTGSDPYTGGTLTLVASLAATSTLTILRSVTQQQDTDLTESGPLPADTIEDRFDKLTMMVQELQAQSDRSLKIARTDDAIDDSIPNAIDRASSYMYFGSDGAPAVSDAVAPSTAVISSFMESVLDDASGKLALATMGGLTEDDFTAFAKTLLDDTTALLARGTLGLDTDDNVEHAIITSTDLKTKSPWADVRAYGATGDGSTDDTAAIQAAIDALTSGGTVFFPQGTYKVTSALTVDVNSIRLTGTGKASIIVTTSTTANVIEIQGDGSVYPNDRLGVKVDHLSIQGPDTGTAGAGVYVRNAHECIISNNWFSERGKGTFYGIHFDGRSNEDTDNCIIKNNVITGTVDDGIRLLPNPITLHGACEENVVSGNVITGCGGRGIVCYGQKNTISANTIEESSKGGIVIGGDHNVVSANTCCENSWSGISLEHAGHPIYGNTVIGNICRDNDLSNTKTYHGIVLAIAYNSTIVGNICVNNDGNEIDIGAGAVDNLIVGNNVDAETPDHEGTIVDAGLRTRMYGNFTGASTTVASASTVTLPIDGNYFSISGTTGITSITASWAGRRVVLKFEGTLTVTDGSNLKLAGDFSATADDCLPLVCNGTNWYQEGGSNN